MKTIKKTYCLLLIAFILWFILSWLDVVIHNTAPGYEYSNINLIYLLIKEL